MLDELIKALGPYPAIQMALIVLSVAAGVYAIYKGIMSQNKDGGARMEEKKAEWEAYGQLKNIEQNTFKIAENQEKLIAAMVRLTDAMWNRRQFGGD